MLRKWVANFTKSLSKRTSSRRLEVNVPVKLSLEADRCTGSLSKPLGRLAITGETRDFSTSGISFQVSSIRLQDYYLVGEGRTLKAEMVLPTGRVTMTILGMRYEQTGEHLSITQYLVGAKIVDMTERDRALFDDFLQGKKEKAGSLQLETEKS